MERVKRMVGDVTMVRAGSVPNRQPVVPADPLSRSSSAVPPLEGSGAQSATSPLPSSAFPPLAAQATNLFQSVAAFMSDVPQADSSDRGDRPGKIRTIWHPLLVRLLTVTLGSAFKVEQEISVGKMPLRVDILLIRREGGELSAADARDLAELLPLLNRFTLVEFKAPTDALERGDFAQLLGCAYLWHGQQSEPVTREEISLLVVAPNVNAPLRDDLRLLGCEIREHEAGIFRVSGQPLAIWLVETDVMAERVRPILSLVSRAFLNDRESIIERLAELGEAALARCHYVVQQVQQFRKEEDMAMQETLTKTLKEFDEELVDRIVQGLPAERRLRGLPPEEVLRVVPPEERLRGLPPEERLRGLSPEQRLAGLSEQEAARMRELLERKKE